MYVSYCRKQQFTLQIANNFFAFGEPKSTNVHVCPFFATIVYLMLPLHREKKTQQKQHLICKETFT